VVRILTVGSRLTSHVVMWPLGRGEM